METKIRILNRCLPIPPLVGWSAPGLGAPGTGNSGGNCGGPTGVSGPAPPPSARQKTINGDKFMMREHILQDSHLHTKCLISIEVMWLCLCPQIWIWEADNVLTFLRLWILLGIILPAWTYLLKIYSAISKKTKKTKTLLEMKFSHVVLL